MDGAFMAKQYTKDFYMERRQLTKISAEIILGLLFSKIESNSVIDFGCATGTWLAECKEQGVGTILGLDGGWVDTKLLEIEADEFLECDLGATKYISERKYDLALCIEVAEHIPKNMEETLIRSITEASDVILFSAAICGQGGTGHVNEQPQHYWAGQFAIRGYICVDLIRPQIWEHESVNVIYKQNMFLYVRKSIYKELDLEASVISELFDLDRIHPDLFFMRSSIVGAGSWTKIVKYLKYIAGRACFKR
jgi:hypothetical protein